ncbi:MAG: RelA/SpoT family protein [Nitrospirota bacterium]
MISLEDIVKKVLVYSPKSQVDLIKKGYDLAAIAHEGQVRQSGEPYLKHPLEVAYIVTELKLDAVSITSALLHDIVEDTPFTLKEIEKHLGPFGKDIVSIVDGLTKIGKISFKNREEKQAENFRKMIISMANDIRVILIKLADRLHNMRTLYYLSEYKRIRVAQETLDIYIPIANRLGIGWIKIELEDLCFRYIKPDIYFNLTKKIAKKKNERERYIKKIINIVKKNLKKYNFKGEVVGRPKHIYSIYQKMERQGIPFEEVYDKSAIRIITDSKMACYELLGIIHSIWKPVPGRFKDYIGIPKYNMYQSLHTTVIGPDGEHIEVQIRSEEMHRVAEDGIASHWKYKEKGEIDEKDNRTFGWLRQLVEWQRDILDNRQFMDYMKTGLLPEVVYVFTPKGDVKELIKGSSPIDFAYSIHTEIGNHCTGAKISGKIVPLKYQLKTGDTVEIITSPAQVPSRDWLKIIKTPKSKSKVKHWITTEERKRSLEIGKKSMEQEVRRHNLSPGEVFKSEKLREIIKEHRLKDLQDLLISIGYGRISTGSIINKLIPVTELKETLKDKIVKKMGIYDKGVKIKGISEILINFSKCCNPVPGDKIIGFITRGRGLSIHTLDCPNIDELDYDKNRLIDVEWEIKGRPVHPAKICVLSVDKPGLLANISASITSANANISHADITTTDDKKAVFKFVIEIIDARHLDKILRNIEKVEGVLRARRVRRG